MKTDNDFFKDIGKRLREAREKKRYSQKELANMMDIIPNQYSKVETSRVIPSLKTLVKVAKALEISTDELIFGEKVVRKTKVKNEDLADKMNIIDELPIEDKFIAIEIIDLIIARKTIKEMAVTFSKTHPNFKK